MKFYHSPVLPARRMFDCKKIRSALSKLKKRLKRQKKGSLLRVDPTAVFPVIIITPPESPSESPMTSVPSSAPEPESTAEKAAELEVDSMDSSSIIYHDDKNSDESFDDTDELPSASEYLATLKEDPVDSDEDSSYQNNNANILSDDETLTKHVRNLSNAATGAEMPLPAGETLNKIAEVDGVNGSIPWSVMPCLFVPQKTNTAGFRKSKRRELYFIDEVEEEEEEAPAAPAEIQPAFILTMPEVLPQDPTSTVGLAMESWTTKTMDVNASSTQTSEKSTVVTVDEGSNQLLENKPTEQLRAPEQDTGAKSNELQTAIAVDDIEKEPLPFLEEAQEIQPEKVVAAEAIAPSIQVDEIDTSTPETPTIPETNVVPQSNDFQGVEVEIKPDPERKSSRGWEIFSAKQKLQLARLIPIMEEEERIERERHGKYEVAALPDIFTPTPPVSAESLKANSVVLPEEPNPVPPSSSATAQEEQRVDTTTPAAATALTTSIETVRNEDCSLPHSKEESVRAGDYQHDQDIQDSQIHHDIVDPHAHHDDQKTLTNDSDLEPCTSVDSHSSSSCVDIDEFEVVHAKSSDPCKEAISLPQEFESDDDHVVDLVYDLAPTSNEPEPNRDHSVAVVEGDHSLTSAGRLVTPMKNSTKHGHKLKVVGLFKKCFSSKSNKRSRGDEGDLQLPPSSDEDADSSSMSSEESNEVFDPTFFIDSVTCAGHSRIKFGGDSVVHYSQHLATSTLMQPSDSPYTSHSRSSHSFYSHMNIVSTSVDTDYRKGSKSVPIHKKLVVETAGPVSILKTKNPHYRWEKFYVVVFSRFVR